MPSHMLRADVIEMDDTMIPASRIVTSGRETNINQ